MDHSTYADVELKIAWTTDRTSHTERHYYQGINFWRDFFPGLLADKLISAPDGEWVGETIAADEIVSAYSTGNVTELDISKIRPVGKANIMVSPRKGRFYPRRIIAGSAGVTADEFFPLRVTDVTNNRFTADLNHPLARHQLDISLRVVGERYTGKEERGGRCNDIVYELLMDGPGLQSPFPGGVDYYSDDAFSRIDERDDALLYQDPNLDDTFDQASGSELSALYGRYVQAGDRVLDMMCGAQSYLPADIDLDVTGIGLNEDELRANPRLGRHVVGNVNSEPELPFEDRQFDTIVFTAAVEYLTNPVKSFAELARITRPGGHIIVTFTDHWVAAKSILLWSELHPFERMGLVLDYFDRTGNTTRLYTETIQGLLRPEDDPYANRKLYADPVYAVVAQVN